jgi:type II secretory pathway pseudopilin PulG
MRQKLILVVVVAAIAILIRPAVGRALSRARRRWVLRNAIREAELLLRAIPQGAPTYWAREMEGVVTGYEQQLVSVGGRPRPRRQYTWAR